MKFKNFQDIEFDKYGWGVSLFDNGYGVRVVPTPKKSCYEIDVIYGSKENWRVDVSIPFEIDQTIDGINRKMIEVQKFPAIPL